jgi:uncharacterized protein YkwD
MRMPSRWRLLAFAPLLPAALALSLPATPPLAPGCAGDAPAAAHADLEQRLAVLVNEQRRAAGLPPLKTVEPLAGSARFFARLMAEDNYFPEDHDTYRRVGDRLVRVCDWSARIATFYPDWTSLAETIASGYGRPEEVVAGWMASPGHRAKILGRANWETGVGCWTGGSLGWYWAQDFGRRRGVFPVVIDGEAPTTPSRLVHVHAYGDWMEMRVANDGGAFGPWRPFASDFDWTLDAAAGTRTVTVQMRAGRRTASSSDAIVLEGGAM